MSIDIRLGPWQERLRDVPDGSVRLILTSPPYDNARTYEGTQTEPVDFDELGAFCLRVLMPGGVLAMVLDGAVNDGEQSTTPNEVICSWASGLPHAVLRALMRGERADVPPVQRPPWRFLQELAYGRDGAPGAYKGRFRKDHEPLIVFVRDGDEHICEKDRIAVKAAHDMRASVGNSYATRRDGSKAVFGQDSRGNKRIVRDILHRGSVWKYGRIGNGQDASASTGHPATFAEAFAVDAVKVWSNPGDLVCDPYSGSGTVAKVCRDLDRSFVGTERVPLYHEMSLRRLDPTYISEERAADVGALGPLFAGGAP